MTLADILRQVKVELEADRQSMPILRRTRRELITQTMDAIDKAIEAEKELADELALLGAQVAIHWEQRDKPPSFEEWGARFDALLGRINPEYLRKRERFESEYDPTYQFTKKELEIEDREGGKEK